MKFIWAFWLIVSVLLATVSISEVIFSKRKVMFRLKTFMKNLLLIIFWPLALFSIDGRKFILKKLKKDILMKKLLMMGMMVVMAASLSACGVEVVDTGHRGVETNFGKVNEDLGSLPEGLYFYNPFTSDIIEMDTRVEKWQTKTIAYTKDVQQATIEFGVNYHMVRDRVHIMYRDVGRDWDNRLLPPIVQGQIKAVVGKWDAVELIANREKATREIESAIKTALLDKDVVLTKFEMTNIDYADEFEQAVENKVTAIQRAEAEKNRTVQISEQADQKLIIAQAHAEAMRIKAKALSQNKALVEYEAVRKWDGKMPQYMMGNTVPFLNLGNNQR
jgi:regulator of protease activity HflC (stomatin/prohibitin superfamily)